MWKVGIAAHDNNFPVPLPYFMYGSREDLSVIPSTEKSWLPQVRMKRTAPSTTKVLTRIRIRSSLSRFVEEHRHDKSNSQDALGCGVVGCGENPSRVLHAYCSNTSYWEARFHSLGQRQRRRAFLCSEPSKRKCGVAAQFVTMSMPMVPC